MTRFVSVFLCCGDEALCCIGCPLRIVNRLTEDGRGACKGLHPPQAAICVASFSLSHKIAPNAPNPLHFTLIPWALSLAHMFCLQLLAPRMHNAVDGEREAAMNLIKRECKVICLNLYDINVIPHFLFPLLQFSFHISVSTNQTHFDANSLTSVAET